MFGPANVQPPTLPEGQPSARVKSHKFAQTTLELSVIALIAVLIWTAAYFFDLSESFVDWASRYRDWKFAEIITLLAGLSFAFAFFAFRRVKDLHEETRARIQTAEALQQANVEMQSLLQASPAAIIAVDREGKVTAWNPAAERMFGWRAEEILGLPLPIIPNDLYGDYLARLQNELAGRYVVGLELQRKRKDGTLVEISLSTGPCQNSAGEIVGVMGILQDVTERKQSEDRLRREAVRTEAMLRVAARLNSQIDHDDVLDAICEETALALKAPIVTLRMYDRQRNYYVCSSNYGLPPGACTVLPPIPPESVIELFQEGSPYAFVADIQTLSNLPSGEFYKDLDLRSVISFKMDRGGEILGLMSVASVGAVRHFTRDDLALLKGLADLAAESIEKARIYQSAKRRSDLLHSLRLIDMSISGSLDLRVTLSVILEHVIHHLEVDATSILLFHSQKGVLEYAAGRGFHSQGITQTRLRPGEGIAGEAGQSLVMRSVADLRDERTEFVRYSLLGEEGFIAYTAAPLVSKGELKGVLEVFHRSPLDPDEEWKETLEMLSGQAAIAIDNATMFDHLQLSNIELTLAYDITLEGWVKALDLRDKETEGHTQRVTEMTMELSQAMGMSDEQLVHIRRGALLHDIGKIGIPDGILLKPGPLDPEERALMQLHTIYAHEFLSTIPYLHPALDIPYCHHERWDGSGYPRGLNGYAIPLSARIFAVVDVWDSLRSNRPYRMGWPEEKVLDYIRTLSGEQFDPVVVKEFLQLLETRQVPVPHYGTSQAAEKVIGN